MNRKAIGCWLMIWGLAGFAPAEVVQPPSEVTEPAYIYEVLQHLYRWYMDEEDVERGAGVRNFPVWVCPWQPKLDAGDKSQMAKLMFPGLGIGVTVKKADYRIDELDVDVRSEGFKIVNVARGALPTNPPSDALVVDIDYENMVDYLFQQRSRRLFPDEALGLRLKQALGEELQITPGAYSNTLLLAYLAPMSPVANEFWVFWETQSMLIRFASDIDLANPAVWDHESLAVKTYNVHDQVVVSLEEAVGSNRFLTRDQVGRALYNCVVLGQRLLIEPQGATNRSSKESAP